IRSESDRRAVGDADLSGLPMDDPGRRRSDVRRRLQRKSALRAARDRRCDHPRLFRPLQIHSGEELRLPGDRGRRQGDRPSELTERSTVSVLIELAKETAGYGGRPVLHGVDLAIRAGERVAVMGRSGAGKTTLLNLLYMRLAERVALVPQGSALVKTLSVFHNVYMGRLDRHPTWYNIRTLIWPARRVIGEVAAVLDLVGLRDLLFARAGELSGGQQQRAPGARALYHRRPVPIRRQP